MNSPSIKPESMDRNQSTLEPIQHDKTIRAPELAKYDRTARAPERDYDATACELDASALAPQAIPDTAPQVLYDRSLPEAHGKNEMSIEERVLYPQIANSIYKWLWLIIALVIAIAIAVGVGVGIWYHRKHSLHQSSTFISPSAQPAAQVILNDTSLAAVSLANGDRQLFFQDSSGLIQRAIYTASNDQWSTSASQSLNLNSNPKNHTPLTVFMDGFSALELYYISESHSLNSCTFDGTDWIPSATWGTNYSTAVNSRSLSIASIPSELISTNSTIDSALLFYENPIGNVSVLLQRVTPTNSNSSLNRFDWFDITSQESKSLPDEFRNTPEMKRTQYSNIFYESDAGLTYSAPFTSRISFSGSTIGAYFFSPSGAGDSIVSSFYLAGPGGTGKFARMSSSVSTLHFSNSTPQSDIAMFGFEHAIWIDGTQPAFLTGGYLKVELPDPNKSFPFARLASATSADQSTTFIYHQMNGTTFAEERWDNTEGAWLPFVYITVSDP